MEDYIKCELIGGGSPRYLNTIYNSLIVAVHYTHIVAIVVCTHAHHVVHNKTSEHTRYCCNC